MINNPLADFVWPEYKNDKERIKLFSRKYKDVGIAEAFAQEYNQPISTNLSVYVNEVPIEPRIGDVIDVHISSITKNLITFNTMSLKKDVTSKVNLYKYDFFKQYIPKEPVKALVTDVDKQRIVVDPIAPLIDRWLYNHIGDKLYQKNIANPKPIRVKNLQLTKGGFLGEAVISDVVDFIHEDYTIPAFIPGSQIVLNIAEDFESFIGQDVDAFVVSHLKKGNGEISVICSVKDYVRFQGECKMINMFNSWCDGTEYWKEVESTTWAGKVTGIINSAKKCGIFVEIPELSITGLIAAKPEELVGYKPHSDISVKILGFDEETFFNQTMKQVQHVEPYSIINGSLERCGLKPILGFA